MSPPSPDVSTVDWKLVGSAVGVLIATIITTVWGWYQGRKKSRVGAAEPAFQIAGAVLQDNTSLRDNTHAVRELRDQIFLLNHTIERQVKVQDDLSDDIEKLLRRLDKIG